MFDTLEDPAPPEADGLFIGGGFPERSMEALEANASMRSSLRSRVAAGMPVYAECGGLMYLARRIRWNGRVCEMVGAIPAEVVMHPRPRGRGYTVLQPSGDAPWAPAATGPVHAHEFHHSSLENLSSPICATRTGSGAATASTDRGTASSFGSLLASYGHLRDVEGCRLGRTLRRIRARSQGGVPRISEPSGDRDGALAAPHVGRRASVRLGASVID